MDMDHQKYIDAMRDLFMTEGWDWIQVECTDAANHYSDLDNLSTNEQLWFAKGVRLMAAQILNLPSNITDLEAELAEAKDE